MKVTFCHILIFSYLTLKTCELALKEGYIEVTAFAPFDLKLLKLLIVQYSENS